jgi:hypothetical protein
MNGLGLPSTNGFLPAAVSTAATIDPVPEQNNLPHVLLFFKGFCKQSLSS